MYTRFKCPRARLLIACVVCVLLPTVPLAAQRVTSLSAGARVRVAFVSGAEPGRSPRLVGDLVAADDSALVLADPSRRRGPAIVPLRHATQLEVSDGRGGSHAGRGAWTGLGIGAAAGFLLGLYIGQDDVSGCGCGPGLGVLYGAATGVIGILAGAAIGSAIPNETWRPVSLPVQVTPAAPR